ncbi:PP2C family protein-serine/threonine phosphatase, partial [Actinomadura adrarensis]
VGRHLNEAVAREPHLASMGTTLTVLLLDRNRAALAHIGDSRAYLLRDGRLSPLTTDHTVVRTLVDSGLLTSQQAAEHPQRSLLCKALDAGGTAEPDVSAQQLYPGDRLLLCSDGLSGAHIIEFPNPIQGGTSANTIYVATTSPDPSGEIT